MNTLPANISVWPKLIHYLIGWSYGPNLNFFPYLTMSSDFPKCWKLSPKVLTNKNSHKTHLNGVFASNIYFKNPCLVILWPSLLTLEPQTFRTVQHSSRKSSKPTKSHILHIWMKLCLQNYMFYHVWSFLDLDLWMSMFRNIRHCSSTTLPP